MLMAFSVVKTAVVQVGGPDAVRIAVFQQAALANLNMTRCRADLIPAWGMGGPGAKGTPFMQLPMSIQLFQELFVHHAPAQLLSPAQPGDQPL
jgi:hypothetical protein